MSYYQRTPAVSFGPGGRLPWGVKWLLISNTAVFVVYFLSVQLKITPLVWLFHSLLSLTPAMVIKGAILWQPITYLFLHSPYTLWHLGFNMLYLWFFGTELERDWGTRRFLNFYFFCGIGAGLCDVAARYLIGPQDLNIPTIGASGAIYGVLLAFGLLYPNRQILVFLTFPIPIRIFVGILGGIAFLSTFGASGSGTSHMAHLGGMAFGYFYLRSRPDVLDTDWLGSFKSWQRRRAKRKFEVYMRKHNRPRDGGWVN